MPLLRFTPQEFIFQYRIGSISDCVPLQAFTPNYRKFVLYVHCMSPSTCILADVYMYLPKTYTVRFIFKHRIGLHLGLQDCLRHGLSDSVLLLLPMTELLYHSNGVILLEFKKRGRVSYFLYTTLQTLRMVKSVYPPTL